MHDSAKFLAKLTKNWDCRAVQRSALCRSRRELSNAYFLAKFGFDTAENEPCQVYPTEECSSQRVLEKPRRRRAARARCTGSSPQIGYYWYLRRTGTPVYPSRFTGRIGIAVFRVPVRKTGKKLLLWMVYWYSDTFGEFRRNFITIDQNSERDIDVA